ncbi:SET domain-containing protein-lysine N-methyltransferase [Paraflavitalea sp. CAU 1676]|uniref:SET domain-containing protein n=1 Tax=Paraflavitalea sp. CAU 1676 TaxID=3032598 RepID=UPI0023DADED2|nr:SET domain-containing protein-lysine N-methyltransferase [Paraflavitalea sp. CAU 1676]MDF2189600.1 SET domain-containing protein-lysine N-methyltransferase [Paraflavitalea sp. CAU 1676]
MALLEKQLTVKKSTIPGAGKGLFTQKAIPKGTRIIEYRGKSSTWKDVEHNEGNNGYIYYVSRNFVLDAQHDKTSLARYANDARGIGRVKGITNNSEYVTEGNRVFIEALKDIPARSEILVSYGPEYWQVIRHNLKVDAINERERLKKAQNGKKVSAKGAATKKAGMPKGTATKKAVESKSAPAKKKATRTARKSKALAA